MSRDITNLQFGRLTALYSTEQRKSGYTVWVCVCECGNKKHVSVNHLLKGNVKSCGCLVKEKWWTDKEIYQLRELAQYYGDEGIARRMSRTPSSIRGKRSLLGIPLGHPQNMPWSDEEITHLKDLVAQKKSNGEIAIILNRSHKAIKQAKYHLGYRDFTIRKWTEEEIRKLRELAKEYTTAEIANFFNRDWTAVERKCNALGITTQSKNIIILGNYTQEEDDYIIKVSRYKTNEQISKKLGRTEASVKQRKSRLRKKGFSIDSYTKVDSRIKT